MPSSSRPLRFGKAAAELEAALQRCVLFDRSDLGRLRATGKDILGLLHRLTTADLLTLSPGEGRPTVITTPKGRIVDRLFVHHLGGGQGVLLVTSPGAAPKVRGHVDRYTFREETGLEDESDSSSQLVLVGPLAREIASKAGIPAPAAFGVGRWEPVGVRVLVLGGDGFSSEGLSFVVPVEQGATVWSTLKQIVENAGGLPAGDEALEAWRVLRGYPASGRELTEEHNPLEAGLWDAVSFTKGCYVGQEVVARLNTYDKVSRMLVGLVLPVDAPAPPTGTVLIREGREIGRISTPLVPPGRRAPVALAYVKRDVAGEGDLVQVGAAEAPVAARLCGLPFGETP